ncbi:MAG: CCA tRNA nucleotidyltransferase [Candidatus Dormibacteria bacterium]
MPERRPGVEVLPETPSAEGLLDLLPAMEAALGTRACLVGGYPRDLLMGRASSPDVDVVLEQVDAELGARWLRSSWGRRGKVVSFERYGTAQIAFPIGAGDRFTVEFVRARSEAYSPESRKPTVSPGTMEEDVLRRDFTINTLLLSAQGELLDPTGLGLADIRRRLLRTPLAPRLTFEEDPLRMLRAVRFASQLDFELAPGVEEAIQEAAPRLRIVSRERVREELLKLLMGQRPSRGMELLHRTGLLLEISPELEQMSGVEQGGYHLGDVLQHTALALDLSAPSRQVRLAVLFHDVGKPSTRQPAPGGPTFRGHAQVGAGMARDVLRRLRFSAAETAQVARLVELHMRPIQYHSDWADSAVRRLWRDADDLIWDLLELARADTKASSYPGTAELEELEGRLREVAADHPGGLRPPLGGNPLKEHFSLGDGPWIRRAQSQLVEAVLEGRLQPRDGEVAKPDALRLLEEDRDSWWPRPGEAGSSEVGPAQDGVGHPPG